MGGTATKDYEDRIKEKRRRRDFPRRRASMCSADNASQSGTCYGRCAIRTRRISREERKKGGGVRHGET